MIDVVIPTITGREKSLERLLASLESVDEDLNEIIVKDSITCGWGWKTGLESCEGEYVLLACDDQEYPYPGWEKVCIEAVEGGKLPCPRVWTPAEQIESQGGDMNALHHLIRRPQKDGTLVDYTTVPFLSREMAEKIQMLPVHYASDLWVSRRGRQLGYETVLCHGFDVRHWQERVGRGAGMAQSERDALDVATVEKVLSYQLEAA